LKTVLRSQTKEAVIGPDLPFVIIGERINPTGRKALRAELQKGNFDRVRADAEAQVEAGAGMLDVNAGVPGANEPELLVAMVRIVQELVDVPLSIDSSVVEAIAAALPVCEGKPLVNSVTGEEERLAAILPLVKKNGAAVIGLTHDETGISMVPEERLAVARRIVERAADHGIPAEDVVLDPLAMSVGADSSAPAVTLETARLIRRELGNNLTLGASNISFGLPDRGELNRAFLSMAMLAGVTCAIANPLAPGICKMVMASDVLLGRDRYALQWIKRHRREQKA